MILANEFATEEELKAIDLKIKERVGESVKFAENAPYPSIDEVYKDVYAEENYPFNRE